MVDLNKFSTQIDLKDLDAEKLLRMVIENQQKIIKLVLIIAALMTGGNILNDYRVKAKVIHDQMKDAQDKIDTIKSRDTALEDIVKFKSSLPKTLTESQFITQLSKYAKAHHVQITSLSPGDSRDMGLYDLLSVSLDAEADSFKDLLIFINSIEKSKSPLRIENWNGSEAVRGKITFSIKISALNIHTS